MESVLDERVLAGKTQFHIKWEGFDINDATWEPLENIQEPVIEEFRQSQVSSYVCTIVSPKLYTITLGVHICMYVFIYIYRSGNLKTCSKDHIFSEHQR